MLLSGLKPSDQSHLRAPSALLHAAFGAKALRSDPADVDRSHPADVDRLRAAVARLGLELDLRSLGEGRAVGDAALMDEEVHAAVVGGDEAVPLLVAEPLHGASCHVLGAPYLGGWARAPYSARPPSVRRWRRGRDQPP